MKTKNLLGKLSLLTLLAVATQSCKKENGIDNNNVIQRPYVLYAADKQGTLYKTNDGNNYETIFSGDGTPIRSMAVSKANLIIVKNATAFYSKNEGRTFNAVSNLTVSVPTNIKWPGFLLDVPKFKVVQLVNVSGVGGLSISPSNGEYYNADTAWTSPAPSTESLTIAGDEVLFCYSLVGSKLYMRTDSSAKWQQRGASGLPTPYNFYLSRFGKTLIATDYDGLEGSWYSNDSGANFKQYTGTPKTTIYATYGAFEKLLIGTDSGVYVAEGTKFAASNSGLATRTKVYSIVAKDNYYKNDASKKVIYIATDKGIYRSEDMAKSWVKVKDGDYRLLY
ncbi:MAG TPA: hypothetical protein VL092_10860 [Chitinophagaceae bacterium]|nr:hypothetical protein [Chitinophagaceae bacterium]